MSENLIGIIGLSSIISIILTFIIDHFKTRLNLKFEKNFLEKENRYRSMLIFMSVVLDESNASHIETAYKPNNENSKDYYLKEVILHKNFFYLFASKIVIEEIDNFILNPTEITFQNVAMAMRKDLWSKK